MTRKDEIKRYLSNHIFTLETIRLLREQLLVFERLESEGEKFTEAEREFTIQKLKKYQDLLETAGKLEIGIKLLNTKENEKDKEIVECIYLYGYSITKTAQQVGYSESAVKKRLDIIYGKLDKFI